MEGIGSDGMENLWSIIKNFKSLKHKFDGLENFNPLEGAFFSYKKTDEI